MNPVIVKNWYVTARILFTIQMASCMTGVYLAHLLCQLLQRTTPVSLFSIHFCRWQKCFYFFVLFLLDWWSPMRWRRTRSLHLRTTKSSAATSQSRPVSSTKWWTYRPLLLPRWAVWPDWIIFCKAWVTNLEFDLQWWIWA